MFFAKRLIAGFGGHGRRFAFSGVPNRDRSMKSSSQALSFMTRQMAPELAPKVRVNAIELGGIETDALASVLTDDSIRRQLEDNTPMRRVGQVEDIAAFAVYLASPASAWVTGKVFEIDGGVEHPAFTVPVDPL